MFRLPRKLSITYAVIAINVIVYVYTSIIGGDFMTTGEQPILLYGQVNLLVMSGWYWQLLTAMFVHVNIAHLASNMLFLLIFGIRAEEFLSKKEYLFIYLLSGLAGNALTLLLGPSMISAGASGAIFGMFGAVTIYMRRLVGQPLIGALAYAFLMLMLSVSMQVNIMAHLGGLVAGLLCGYELAARRKPRPTYQYSYAYSA